MSTMQFTALIRLPFARAEFVDPPQADWNAAKDRALWKVISKSSKTSDLNWVELADRFQVHPTFLLQQAAWLYERHLDHVRAQMKKVGTTNAPGTPTSSSTSPSAVGGVPMRRGGSSGSAASRAPSALSARMRENPLPQGDISITAPPLSRTPSTTTITQSKAYPTQTSLRVQTERQRRPNLSSPVRSEPTTNALSPAFSQNDTEEGDSQRAAEYSSRSSSSSDSDVDSPAHRSQLFKRPPRFRQQWLKESPVHNEGFDGEDDHELVPNASLPFAASRLRPNVPHTRTGKQNSVSQSPNKAEKQALASPFSPSQTVSSRHETSARESPIAPTDKRADTASSIASSTSDAARVISVAPSPLSPKQRAGTSTLSPKRLGLKGKREGSEGTPSMGSSFSDIDDASLSQSALEEALLSNIQHGRMSTLSQLRSRYL
ncbi:hypothetical protein P154DRAFT_526027 [Amniculicola lignicola CBS 123094]|uniref:Autophagy-related protein 29 n=1 Tax=Amniculicola lignicola CBS 123094 TaxID=1392246 RepID=A0A6A5W3I3_9PLEO|nr:hypothetical protein P154DRAFT_526027 [Amniculicola lignicola CBS 123094]